MTTIKFENGQNSVYNEMGKQADGSFSAGSEVGLNPRELLEASIGL